MSIQLFKHLFVYPWDIVDNGIEEALLSIKKLGISSIGIATFYHEAKIFTPNNKRRAVYYNKSSSAYFKPDKKKYRDLECKTSQYFDNYLKCNNSDMMSDIISVAISNELNVNSWVVVLHNSYLASQFPNFAVTNLYSEVYTHALCPSNPEVTDYAISLLIDIAENYKFKNLFIESLDYSGFLHGDHHEMIGIKDTETLEKILGLCFCERCKQKAIHLGIDVKKLISGLKYSLDYLRMLKAVDFSRISFLIDRYIDMRSMQIENIYKKVYTHLKSKNISTGLFPIIWLMGGSNPAFYGVNVGKLSPFTDGFIAVYPDSADTVVDFVQKTRSLVGYDKKLIGGVRLLAPQVECLDDVRRYIVEYQKSGIGDIIFYNYGLSPYPFLEEITKY